MGLAIPIDMSEAARQAKIPGAARSVLEIGPAENPDASVIVLHGLGADVRDFVRVVRRLPVPSSLRLRWLFPQAPARAVTIEGGRRMSAWYDVRCYDRTEMDEAGICESERTIRGYIRREERRGVPASRIVLAGFSQGGAMALHTGLRHPRRLGGIIALSTALPLPHAVPFRRDGDGPPILMGHGWFDRVLRFGHGAESRDFLAAAGWEVEWHSYLAGHRVCRRELAHVCRWLRRTLALPPRIREPWSEAFQLEAPQRA